MVIGSPDAVLFDFVILAVVLDAANVNCQNPISVTWSSNNATSYQLERRINGGAWTVVYTGAGLSFGENGSPGLYEYRVKAIRGSKFVYSNIDGVTIVAQNVQLSTYCVGYDLWESYSSGCGAANRLLQPLSANCGVVWGCTTPGSKNYNSNATHDDGSCIPPNCVNCGYPRQTIEIQNYTNPQSAVFVLGARPSTGSAYYEYTVTVQLDTGGFDCLAACWHDWSGATSLPAWNGGGWISGGANALTTGQPTLSNSPTLLDYTIGGGSVTLIIAELREPGDSANYFRIRSISLGTCE